MHLPTARFVRKHSRGGDSLEPDLSHIGAARFDKSEDIRHQRTFASV
jgi:hypothetical protein